MLFTVFLITNAPFAGWNFQIGTTNIVIVSHLNTVCTHKNDICYYLNSQLGLTWRHNNVKSLIHREMLTFYAETEITVPYISMLSTYCNHEKVLLYSNEN
jgi:hypothetical protein